MKKIISFLLSGLMILSAVTAASASDENEVYCRLECENGTIETEQFTVNIRILDYGSGENENVTFHYTYDEKLLSVDELNEDGRITLFIEGKVKAETTLLIEMLSEEGKILASDEITVKISGYPAGDMLKAAANAEYYFILFFMYILPDVLSIPFRYIQSAFIEFYS